MDLIITILYTTALLYIFLFSMAQLHLTWLYIRERKKEHEPVINPAFEPAVTIQLPVYNEKYVIARLLEAVGALDYPKDKFDIQVLDDSTDETSQIIAEALPALRSRGINIKHIRRPGREGFKAGALQFGLPEASGDFIAIFDADFIPEPSFLRQTLPYLADPAVGVIQTRWAHINEGYSLLTQLQAFGLDAHFSIEQTARNAAGSFINFNGTGGVWRKNCIVQSGGWSADTLTEDLDLSYRAQLAGWKFKYVESIATLGELPVMMQSIKSQQYRWNKGGAETARKHLRKVLRSNVPLMTKIHACFHLLNSAVFVGVLMAGILSVPMLFILQRSAKYEWIFYLGLVLLAGFFSIAFFYWTATRRFHHHALKKFLQRFPAFLIVSMGLSLHNGFAVLQGLAGFKTPFVRTPKFNITGNQVRLNNNGYFKPVINVMTIAEGLLCVYFTTAIVMGIVMQNTSLLLFHFMLSSGFGIVFFYSIKPFTHE
ncbi:MAG TPA: cellulose synthase family protein [Ohtaekwangia sp.]|nr:cellulose synthase family protein [Ohtaekwangia sp.]